jgi:glycosyltransferase 2 family protein
VRRLLLLLVGLAISGALVYLAVQSLDLGVVRRTLSGAAVWPWVPAAMATYVVGQLLRGWRCQALVKRDAPLTLATATNIVVVGYAVNNVAPLRLGEFARAAMLSERAGLPFAQSLGVTFLERVLDGLTVLGLLVVAIFALGDSTWLDLVAAPAALIFGVATVGVALAVVAPSALVGTASAVGGLLGRKIQEVGIRLAVQTTASVRALRRPDQAALILMLSVLVWLVEGAMFLLILGAFDLPLRFDWALLAMAVTNLSVLLPSSPGHIGPFHYFCQQAVVSVGVAADVGLAYAVGVHLAFYVPVTLWGVGLIIWYAQAGSWRLSMLRRAKTATGTAASGVGRVVAVSSPPAPVGGPTRFLAALVGALIPKDVAGDEARAAVTTSFVNDRLADLPAKLRLLLLIGLTAFRVLVVLRFLRTFESLPTERRRSVVAAWAYGPLAPARALFKAVRSTALLAAWEQRAS